jgi:hypothetical protein
MSNLPISPLAVALHAAQVFAAVAPPHHHAQRQAEHHAGSSPPVKSAAIDTP